MGNWLFTNRHHNSTALLQAVEANDFKRVKYLLDKGADVNAKTDEDQTCSVIAAVIHADVEILRLLVSAPGVDVNARDSCGHSALYCAVCIPNLDAANVLLEHGAQLGCCVRDTFSELALAASNGDNEMLKLLLPYAAK